MKKIFNKILIIPVVAGFISCTDLDLVPIDEDASTSANFFDSPEAYQQALAKIYGGLYLTGNDGPAGAGDINTPDEGATGYLRMYQWHQVLSTEEAFVGSNFGDLNIRDFQNHQWTANTFPMGELFSRFYYQIANANAFVAQASSSENATIQGYVAEARFLRALSYWHALDLFRTIPLITDEDGVGAFLPEQATPQETFDFIESELLAIEDLLPDPGDVTYYPRATKGAAQMLLAKLYLNAQVYTGTARFDEAAAYTNSVIAHSSYGLEPNYDHLFLADNDQSTELIFVVAQDGTAGTSYGGSAFFANASVGGTMPRSEFGVGGWGGIRTTSTFVDKFMDDNVDDTFDEDAAIDNRANFWVDSQGGKEITDLGSFQGGGYAITKFKNVDRSGNPGASNEFVDTDYPIFRLADAYLMYAELFLRNAANTDATIALGYVNDVRERAYGDNSGNIALGDLTLDFIIDERARELYWESHRRTDLIRFGIFSGGAYTWPLKGGDANLLNGTATGPERDYFPIPAKDLNANPNLKPSDGY
ncbi:RagB/SusD family nutrient uptake outer membrane protein [Ekhidna sp.]